MAKNTIREISGERAEEPKIDPRPSENSQKNEKSINLSNLNASNFSDQIEMDILAVPSYMNYSNFSSKSSRASKLSQKMKDSVGSLVKGPSERRIQPRKGSDLAKSGVSESPVKVGRANLRPSTETNVYPSIADWKKEIKFSRYCEQITSIESNVLDFNDLNF